MSEREWLLMRNQRFELLEFEDYHDSRGRVVIRLLLDDE